MTVRAALLGLALVWRGAQAPAQTIAVRGGEGPGPAILRSAVGESHMLVGPDSARFVLRRDSVYSTTVLVLGRDAEVSSTVHGDVVVVHGDLFLHPGALISGRAVAIGGHVYGDVLAMARQQLSFPDLDYRVVQTSAGFDLEYQPRFSTSQSSGVSHLLTVDRLTYERIEGVAPRARAQLNAGSATGGVDLSYRSQLGALDPGADVSAALGSTTFAARVGRGTFTNDDWIHSDFINSVESLGIGKDLRNYFRADRGEATVSRQTESMNGTIESRVGFRFERDWSVPRDSASTSAPWSFLRWKSTDGMLRANPRISDGHLASLVAGGTWSCAFEDSRAAFSALEEVRLAGSVPGFEQTTLHGQLDLPTRRDESYHLLVHAVLTGGAAPAQRWAYIGGAETIGTLEALSMGGDQLFFVDNQYEWPVHGVEFPLVGAPAFIGHYVLGSAGVGGFPSVQQAFGFRILLVPIYGEALVDPFHRHGKVTAGLSLGF